MTILIPILYSMAGIFAWTAVQCGVFPAWRLADRERILFAVLCLLSALHVLARIGALQAATALEMVSMRSWEVTFAGLFFAVLPWFTAEYTGVRSRAVLIGLTLFLLTVVVVDWILPYGIQFREVPTFNHFVLPWGEKVADLRIRQPSVWHHLGWLGLGASFAFTLYASVQQYRRGEQHKARMLMLATCLFLVFVLFNRAANSGLIQFVHVGEFGFIAMLGVIGMEMARAEREHIHRALAILDHVPAAVCMKDTAGRYLLLNRQFETLFHISPDVALGKTDYALFSSEMAERLCDGDGRVISGRSNLELEVRIVQDNDERTYLCIKFPLLDRSGKPYAACSIMTDVTAIRRERQEVMRLRQQVWHMERVVRTDAIAASLAHELNQPMTAILSNAQAGLRFLDRDPPNVSELREILTDIVHDDKRASSVITNLRAITRRQEVHHVQTDIAACVADVLDILHVDMLYHHVECICNLMPDCVVYADRTLIMQVMLNLLTNAIDAMRDQPPEMRKLIVTVSHDQADEIRVAVRDSGVGISPEHLREIFNAFYTTKPQGLGMGLAVCRSIIESLGGRLWAESNPDRGMTFLFSLHVDRRQRTRESSTPSE